MAGVMAEELELEEVGLEGLRDGWQAYIKRYLRIKLKVER
jgi:hypothetical protein